MAKQFRSRLQRKESKRMMRQGILLFGLTIGLVAVLIIWGIPAMVRLAGLWGEVRSTNQEISSNDTIPPITPRIVIPYEATASAQINISGVTEPGATVALTNSGDEVGQTLADNSGSFTFSDVSLQQGENAFTAVATDGAGNKSSVSSVALVTYDTVPPELEVTGPSDGSEYFGDREQTVTITGSTDPGSQVWVNDNFAFVNSQGEFSHRFSLSEGENTITIRAIDEAGNEAEEELTLRFTR